MAELSRVIRKTIPGTCGSVKYFKFKDNTHSWILPVYEGSYTAQHPAESFPWNKATEFYCTTCCTKCDDCGQNECRLHTGYRAGYKAAIEDIKNQLNNGKIGDINLSR